MIRKLGSHVRNQWMGALALFLVLSGGTAMALTRNTVGALTREERRSAFAKARDALASHLGLTAKQKARFGG